MRALRGGGHAKAKIRFGMSSRRCCGGDFSFFGGKALRSAVWMALLLWAGGVAWGQPEWEEISPLLGHDVGSITRIITQDSGIWTTVSDHPGPNPNLYFRPYYSDDGGDTWELRDSGFPSEVSVIAVRANPQNPERVLASVRGHNSAPYLSLDRGLTWQQVSTGITILNGSGCETGWFADGLHAWCYVYYDLDASFYFFSSDSGITWSGFSNLGNHIKLMTLDDMEGYVIQSHFAGLRISSDFGASWDNWWDTAFYSYYFGGTGSSGSPPGMIYASAEYYFQDQMRVATYPVISQDTGRTWQFLNPADTTRWRDTRFCDILVDPQRAGHLFYTIVDTVFESTDNGQSWTPIWGGAVGVFFKNIIGYDPHRDWVYATGAYPYSEGPSERGIGRLRRGSALEPHQGDATSQPLLRIFPNPVPSGGTLTLELPGQPLRSVVLYNLLGQEVYRHSLANHLHSGGYPVHIALPAAMPSGVYFVSVNGAQPLPVISFIVNR